MIDFIEFKERLLSLNEILKRVKKIDESLADEPEKHRHFATEIEISYADLRNIYESSELNLMIELIKIYENLND